jgi:hypothetical protein
MVGNKRRKLDEKQKSGRTLENTSPLNLQLEQSIGLTEIEVGEIGMIVLSKGE